MSTGMVVCHSHVVGTEQKDDSDFVFSVVAGSGGLTKHLMRDEKFCSLWYVPAALPCTASAGVM